MGFGDDTVSVIDVASGAVSNTIAVGIIPAGVAITPDGTKAYVTNITGNTVSVINVATGVVSSTITVGTSPIGVAMTPCAVVSGTVSTDGRTVTVSGSGLSASTTVTLGACAAVLSFTG